MTPLWWPDGPGTADPADGAADPPASASVRVPVATLWEAPEATRPSDAAALRDEPDLDAWIAAMTPAERTGSDVVTQLLLGDDVLVLEARADGWSRVVAPGQHDYPGWLRTAHLTAPSATSGAFAGAPVVVDALRTVLTRSPAGPVAVFDVMLGTFMTPAGPPTGGWLPVRGPGGPLWIRQRDVVPVPTRPPTGDEVLATARRLLEVPYVWGGLSTLGIDCSGLVHLVWRRLGVSLPRDAHQQQAATAPRRQGLGDEHPGDLHFFARDGRPAHHVGIVVAPGRMLHASTVRRRVVEEAVPADRAATWAGTHRV